MLTQQTGSPSDWAGSDVWVYGGTSVDPGWMGVDARKFRNGSVCEETGYQYNHNEVYYRQTLADSKACGSGTYYSYGAIAVWDPNAATYDSYYSQRSPSLNG